MPANRMNRDEFYAVMAPNDDKLSFATQTQHSSASAANGTRERQFELQKKAKPSHRR
jgi:hypothetical protein